MKILYLVIITIFFLSGCDNYDYKNAIEEINNENYEDAISLLEELDTYKNSNELLYDTQIRYILKLVDEGDIDLVKAKEDEFFSEKSEEEKKEVKYLIANEFFKNEDYYNAKSFYKDLGDYLDSSELYKETRYNLILNYFEEGNISNFYNNSIGLGSYRDYNEMANKLDILDMTQGYWIGDKDKENNWIIISGRVLRGKLDGKNINYTINTSEIDIENEFIPTSYGDLTIRYGKIVGHGFNLSNHKFYSELDLNNFYRITNGESNKKTESLEPFVGMTKSELLNSTWGKPEHKNITTTKKGNYEQWVYSLSKYIYLEDDIVVAIQR